MALTGCGAVAPLDAEPAASADSPVSPPPVLPPPVTPGSPPRAFGEVGLGENYSVAFFRGDRCVATAVDGCVVHRCPNPAISEDAGLLRVIAPGFERSFEAIPRGFLQGSYESIGTISRGASLYVEASGAPAGVPAFVSPPVAIPAPLEGVLPADRRLTPDPWGAASIAWTRSDAAVRLLLRPKLSSGGVGVGTTVACDVPPPSTGFTVSAAARAALPASIELHVGTVATTRVRVGEWAIDVSAHSTGTTFYLPQP